MTQGYSRGACIGLVFEGVSFTYEDRAVARLLEATHNRAHVGVLFVEFDDLDPEPRCEGDTGIDPQGGDQNRLEPERSYRLYGGRGVD